MLFLYFTRGGSNGVGPGCGLYPLILWLYGRLYLLNVLFIEKKDSSFCSELFQIDILAEANYLVQFKSL